jgi:hypothetical protein
LNTTALLVPPRMNTAGIFNCFMACLSQDRYEMRDARYEMNVHQLDSNDLPA